MKLDELRTVQSKERRKDSLQQLRDSFYEDVAAYLQDLKASRDRRAEQVADPFSDSEVRRLSDELETAEEVAEAIYERRVGKVVKLASFAAADMPVDDEGMTGEERRLFEDLVDRIERNKTAVLDVLSGNSESPDSAATGHTESTATQPTASEPTEAEPTAPPSPTERVAEAEAESEPTADGMLADAMGSSESTAERPDQPGHAGAEAAAEQPATEVDRTASTGPSPAEIPPPEAELEADTVVEPSTDGGTTADAGVGSPARHGSASDQPAATATTDSQSASPDRTSTETDDEDRTTLRITKNVGEIFGVDGREYTLQSEDVVTLPTTNAEPLVERDAAMRLD